MLLCDTTFKTPVTSFHNAVTGRICSSRPWCGQKKRVSGPWGVSFIRQIAVSKLDNELLCPTLTISVSCSRDFWDIIKRNVKLQHQLSNNWGLQKELGNLGSGAKITNNVNGFQNLCWFRRDLKRVSRKNCRSDGFFWMFGYEAADR